MEVETPAHLLLGAGCSGHYANWDDERAAVVQLLRSRLPAWSLPQWDGLPLQERLLISLGKSFEPIVHDSVMWPVWVEAAHRWHQFWCRREAYSLLYDACRLLAFG